MCSNEKEVGTARLGQGAKLSSLREYPLKTTTTTKTHVFPFQNKSKLPFSKEMGGGERDRDKERGEGKREKREKRGQRERGKERLGKRERGDGKRRGKERDRGEGRRETEERRERKAERLGGQRVSEKF